MATADRQFFDAFGTFTKNNPGPNENKVDKFALFGGVPTTSLPTSGFGTYNVAAQLANIPFTSESTLPAVGSPGLTICATDPAGASITAH